MEQKEKKKDMKIRMISTLNQNNLKKKTLKESLKIITDNIKKMTNNIKREILTKNLKILMISQNLMTINLKNIKEKAIFIKMKQMANKIMKIKTSTTKTIPQNIMVEKNIMVMGMKDFIFFFQLLCLYLL
jgi:hypothetical protein